MFESVQSLSSPKYLLHPLPHNYRSSNVKPDESTPNDKQGGRKRNRNESKRSLVSSRTNSIVSDSKDHIMSGEKYMRHEEDRMDNVNFFD